MITTQTVLQSVIVVMLIDMGVALEWEPVALEKTRMNGYSKGILRASSMFPMRMQRVKTMMKPERPLSKTVHIILWGSVLEACRFEKVNHKRL